MLEFNDYSQFVMMAYLLSGFILIGFGIFSFLQLKKVLKKDENKKSQKTAKN